ncbi:MAG: hypothetical protein QG639_357 [Patescibacteria group bacterium]|jgi:hypothetical protein|nr:hypothetical protein [Patescibacteria group bacterium]
MGIFNLESRGGDNSKNPSMTEKVAGKAKDAYTGLVLAALTMVEQVASGKGTMVIKGENGFKTVYRSDYENQNKVD